MKLYKTEHFKRFITGSILASIFWIVFFYFPAIVFSLVLLTILAVILAKEWTLLFHDNNCAFWLLMPFYPIAPFLLLVYLNHHPQYHMLLYHLFFIVFSFDTSSYIVGKLIGYHKLAPLFSPHKTLEGFLGGFLGALLAFYWTTKNQYPPVNVMIAFFLVAVICAIALFGDLFESWLKRKAKVKHSGDSLPGHGGFLDRFDAIMMVTFFFFIFRNSLSALLC